MTAAPPLRIVPGLFGAALLTVLCLANGARLLSVDPVVGGFLYLAGILWLGVLIAVQAQAARSVARLAIVGVMLYAAIGALSVAELPAFTTNAAMLKALSLEGLILFAVVFTVSRIPYFWATNETNNSSQN